VQRAFFPRYDDQRPKIGELRNTLEQVWQHRDDISSDMIRNTKIGNRIKKFAELDLADIGNKSNHGDMIQLKNKAQTILQHWGQKYSNGPYNN